jgi:uncharacterized protein (TIGR02285 family)
MVFRDKPPYSYLHNGAPTGFLFEKTKKILDLAGVSAEFSVMPPKRIFLEIQNDAQPVCSFGWYKIPEREKFARFSQPIHQDRPHVILAGPRSFDAVSRHKSLRGLLGDASLSLAVVDGVSYGPEIDAMIARFPGRVDRSLVSPLQVAGMVSMKRADFMFIDQDDLDHLLANNSEFKAIGLQRIDHPDAPQGLKRYILCSQRVTEGTMARIDQAIARLPRLKE